MLVMLREGEENVRQFPYDCEWQASQSRNLHSIVCNETFLVRLRTAVRPGKKFGFQSAAENLQRRRWVCIAIICTDTSA